MNYRANLEVRVPPRIFKEHINVRWETFFFNIFIDVTKYFIVGIGIAKNAA